MFQVESTVTLGNLLTIACVIVSALGLALWIRKFLTLYLVEHEMLMLDYCQRRGLDMDELPTRRSLAKMAGRGL
jgi:hypothetical protein